MNKKNEILKIILIALIAIFLLVGIGVLILSGQRKSEHKEQQKQEAPDRLENVSGVTPTPKPEATAAPTLTVTPTPTVTPAPTLTPTPVPTREPAFHPEDYLGVWYSADGLASMNIYELSETSVTFLFTQSNQSGTKVCEAEVKGEVAGNASQFLFTDSWGNTASGSMTFDNGTLYVNISTIQQVDGLSISPEVEGIMYRERTVNEEPAEPTPLPEPAAEPTTAPVDQTETPAQPGDYYFPESNSRVLTDEELSRYSSEELELAKNEIYARHGRIFVTERISEYFNSKSWYQGTIDPETFDAQQGSIFNEFEVANIDKIAEWEQKKRNEGN